MKTKLITTFLILAATVFPLQVGAAPKLPAAPKALSQARFDVRDFGAKGDGVSDDTKAVQDAIDACRNGTVVLSPGIYRTRMIVLHSDMELHLEEGAVIKATDLQEHFPLMKVESDNINWGKGRSARAFIFALQSHDIRITGPGTIDGNGYAPAWDGLREGGRPIPIYLAQCERVLLDNFLLKDGAMWNIVPYETDDFTMRRVRIDANIVENRDGIDIVDCHRVLVEDCVFYTDDDCICPKSGHRRGVRDVTVRRCRIEKCGRANGIKFGTMSRGGFQDMLFEDITLSDVRLSGIAVESVDGADIKNLIFRNITMDRVGNPIFIIRGLRNTEKAGFVKGLRFENIKATLTTRPWGGVIAGTGKNLVKNVVFKDLDITFMGGLKEVPSTPPEYDGRYPECNMWGNSPAAGFYFRHVRGIRLTGCKIRTESPDARPLFVTEDASVKGL